MGLETNLQNAVVGDSAMVSTLCAIWTQHRLGHCLVGWSCAYMRPSCGSRGDMSSRRDAMSSNSLDTVALEELQAWLP